jgi:hypothetical protein
MDEKTLTIILPHFPEGTAHISRHTEDVPIETADLDEVARIVLAAAVQGHEIKRSADTGSGVIITVTQHVASQNKFGIGGQ